MQCCQGVGRNASKLSFHLQYLQTHSCVYCSSSMLASPPWEGWFSAVPPCRWVSGQVSHLRVFSTMAGGLQAGPLLHWFRSPCQNTFPACYQTHRWAGLLPRVPEFHKGAFVHKRMTNSLLQRGDKKEDA